MKTTPEDMVKLSLPASNSPLAQASEGRKKRFTMVIITCSQQAATSGKIFEARVCSSVAASMSDGPYGSVDMGLTPALWEAEHISDRDSTNDIYEESVRGRK